MEREYIGRYPISLLTRFVSLFKVGRLSVAPHPLFRVPRLLVTVLGSGSDMGSLAYVGHGRLVGLIIY